jgi:hypothetical protein
MIMNKDKDRKGLVFTFNSSKYYFYYIVSISSFIQFKVRWADIEESKKQAHMRQVGWQVGLHWQQLMDPNNCERALTKTKYF